MRKAQIEVMNLREIADCITFRATSDLLARPERRDNPDPRKRDEDRDTEPAKKKTK